MLARIWRTARPSPALSIAAATIASWRLGNWESDDQHYTGACGEMDFPDGARWHSGRGRRRREGANGVGAFRKDVRTHPFVPSTRSPSGPEMLPDEIPLPLAVHAGQMNCALPLDVPNHFGYSILRRYRNHHVRAVRPRVPLLDPALLPLCSRRKISPRYCLTCHIQGSSPGTSE